MNKKIAQLIGWRAPKNLEAAKGFIGRLMLHELGDKAVAFIKSQPEQLDESSIRLESINGDDVIFVVDGYAADHESRSVFNAAVRCGYNAATGDISRLE